MKSVEKQIEEQANWLMDNFQLPTKVRLGKDAYTQYAASMIPKFRASKKKSAKKILTEDVQISSTRTMAGTLKIIRDLSLPSDAVVVE